MSDAQLVIIKQPFFHGRITATHILAGYEQFGRVIDKHQSKILEPVINRMMSIVEHIDKVKA